MKSLALFMTTVLLLSVLASSFVIKAEMVNASSQAFSDEFNSSTLNPSWTWVDTGADCSYSLTANPGYLRINVPHMGNDLYTWTNYDAPRLLQTASGDFTITTRLLFNPLYDAQGAGILIWKDEDNFLRLDRLFDYRGQSVDLSGEQDGIWHYFAETTYTGTSTYLRLERTGGTFTAKYSSDGNNWLVVSSITFPFADPVNIGLFVIVEWEDSPIYADFDYFRVNESTLQSDLWIEDIQPVQTLVNPSIMITGKPTVFKVTVGSTFSEEKSVHLLITCGIESWYEGPYCIKANQKTNIYTGGREVWGQSYRPSGEFTVSIKVDAFNKVAESDETNNALPELIGSENGYHFENLGQLKILYVPTGFWKSLMPGLSTDPDISDCDMQEEVYFSDSFSKAVFPVDPRVYQSEMAAKQPMWAPYLQDLPGRHLESGLRMLQMEMDLKKYHQPSMGKYDRIVAVVPSYNDRGTTWLGFWLGTEAYGMTLRIPYETVSWAEEGYWTTPAHELWHSYTGIPDHCLNWGGPGYWLDYGGLVGAPCLMKVGDQIYHAKSSSNPNLMVPYAWICPQCYTHLTDLNSFRFCNDPEVLFVSGLVFSNDTTNLNPFYYFSEGYAELEPGTTGNYTLRFLDGNQQVLGNIGFNMTFDLDLNVTGFGFAVPYPHDVTQIQILHGEIVIASRDVSANAPTVNITYPNDGVILTSGDNVTIQWESFDADSDPLSYTALYTPDNGSSWIPIETGVTQTSLNWTVPNDHPTTECRIKVVVTDGVNTGEDTSKGTFTIFRHDVATTDIITSKNVVGEGYILPINTTVQNNGNYTETLNLEVYANTTMIHTQSLTLATGNTTTAIFVFNTSGFVKGNYAISVYATPVPGETDTTDNTLVGGYVTVAMVGDISGPTLGIPDGKVDIRDLAYVAKVYGVDYPNPRYNANCDLTGPTLGVADGKIDIRDLAAVAKNFGNIDP